MSDNHSRSLEQLRKLRNKELMRRVRNGESTNSFDSFASWFPPRPKIAKDPKAIQQLYGANATDLQALTAMLARQKDSEDKKQTKPTQQSPEK